jgi:hypothetical protein
MDLIQSIFTGSARVDLGTWYRLAAVLMDMPFPVAFDASAN